MQSLVDQEIRDKSAFKSAFIHIQFNYLLGRVLTLAEATVDKDKLKAVKDMIHMIFKEREAYVEDLAIKEVVENARDAVAGEFPSYLMIPIDKNKQYEFKI